MNTSKDVKISKEKIRTLLTIQLENCGNEPQDFFLFGRGRGYGNYGNHPDVKITCPNVLNKYEVVLSNIQTRDLIITSIFSDKKKKFIFRREDWDGNMKHIGKMVTRPIGVEGKDKCIMVGEDVKLLPDGWKLQPKEKVLLDIETEVTAPVVAALVAPTAFIKINIENTSNKPLKYYLFNANLNFDSGWRGDSNFGNNPAVKITWDSKLLHHSERGKESKYDSAGYYDPPRPRYQKYSDLLQEIRSGRSLNVVNIYSPKRDYFLFTSTLPEGVVNRFTKLALPYPLRYNDKSIVAISGNTTLEPCCLELEPSEKTFIELEVAQWS